MRRLAASRSFTGSEINKFGGSQFQSRISLPNFDKRGNNNSLDESRYENVNCVENTSSANTICSGSFRGGATFPRRATRRSTRKPRRLHRVSTSVDRRRRRSSSSSMRRGGSVPMRSRSYRVTTGDWDSVSHRRRTRRSSSVGGIPRKPTISPAKYNTSPSPQKAPTTCCGCFKKSRVCMKTSTQTNVKLNAKPASTNENATRRRDLERLTALSNETFETSLSVHPIKTFRDGSNKIPRSPSRLPSIMEPPYPFEEVAADCYPGVVESTKNLLGGTSDVNSTPLGQHSDVSPNVPGRPCINRCYSTPTQSYSQSRSCGITVFSPDNQDSTLTEPDVTSIVSAGFDDYSMPISFAISQRQNQTRKSKSFIPTTMSLQEAPFTISTTSPSEEQQVTTVGSSVGGGPLPYFASRTCPDFASADATDAIIVDSVGITEEDLTSVPSMRRMASREAERMPVSVGIVMVITFLVGGSVLFAIYERWNMFDGAYFCFITMTTIGFGDYVPGLKKGGAQESLIVSCVYLLVGMALMAMCFKLMQDDVVAKTRWIGQKIGILVTEDISEDESEYDSDSSPDYFGTTPTAIGGGIRQFGSDSNSHFETTEALCRDDVAY